MLHPVRPPRAEEPEIVVRLLKFEAELARNMAKGWPRSSGELFQSEFGDDGAWYWTISLSEPKLIRHLAWYLARHLTEERPNIRQALLEEGVVGALQKWLILCGVKPAGGPDEQITDPAAAVTWLANAPLQQQWVPASLRRWVQARTPDRARQPQPLPPERSAAVETETPLDVPSADLLEEWIFSQHGQHLTKQDLMNKARAFPELGSYRSADFSAAFGKVYETKRGKPPVTGWSLRSPYKERSAAK